MIDPVIPTTEPATQKEAEISRKTVGQRRINLIWEYTQATIAIGVAFATLFVSGSLSLKGEGQTASFLLLSNAFFMISTFYFVRTNHTKTGGKGETDGESR